MRYALLIGVGLATIAGVQLFVASSRTETYFAWTIGVPLTAAFLGAFYWTSAVIGAVAVCQRQWCRARVGVAGLFVFVSVTSVVTVVHIDKFHLDSGSGTAKLAAWAWLVTYIVDPFLILGAWVMQLRAPGIDPLRTAPTPHWYRALAATLASVTGVTGVVLVVHPASAEDIWPWSLTDLTSGAIAAWVLAMALVLAAAVLERDWTRVRPLTWGCLVFCMLQPIAIVRYHDAVQWRRPATWGFVATFVGLLTVGVVGLIAPGRLASGREARR
jgi:hypothetical protein